MVKIDKNIIIERLNKIHNNSIECNIDEYVNTQIPITFHCKTCGYEWKARPYSVLAGHGCRKCYDKKNSESRKIPLEEIQSVIDKSRADITIIGDYIDTKHKALMRCNKCGYEWNSLVRDAMEGHGCPKCNNSKHTTETFIEYLKTKYGDRYDYSKCIYKGSKEKVTLICNKCRTEINILAVRLTSSNPSIPCEGCRKLDKEKKLKEKEILKEKKRINDENEKLKKEEEKRLKNIELAKIKEIEKNRLKEIRYEQRKLVLEKLREEKTKLFIEKLKLIYKDFDYDYSKTSYVDEETSVIVHCNKHGIDFKRLPKTLLNGNGCHLCNETNTSFKYTDEEWRMKAMEMHPEYDYSESHYVNKDTKIKVICHEKDENGFEHGEFYVIGRNFLTEKGICPKCYYKKLRSKSIDNFKSKVIEKCEHIGYDYNECTFNNRYEKLTLRCKKHGNYFYPSVNNFLYNDSGCPLCANEMVGEYNRKKLDDIISEFKETHNNNYDFSETEEPKNEKDKIKVICREKDENGVEHGAFYTTHRRLLLSYDSCPKCVLNGIRERAKNLRLTQNEFIERLKKIHYGKNYDYSKVKYETLQEKVDLYCPEKDKFGNVHGWFSSPGYSLIAGHGCPKCNSSSLEQEMRSHLLIHNIEFEEQKKFEWLGKQSLDFFIPKLSIAIECQGGQHFLENDFFNKDNKNQIRDNIKFDLCKANNIRIIYYFKNRFEEFVNKEIDYFTNPNDLAIYLSAMLAEIKS